MTWVSAIKTDLRNEILRILREDITYLTSPYDKAATIVPSAIVLQKTRAQINRPDFQSNQMTDVPGLQLCSPMRTYLNPNAGQNNQDSWEYQFLIQLIDVDLWSETDRLDTWEKWIEQIMSALNYNQLNNVIPIPKGNILCSNATAVSDIDEKRWVRDDKFIMGIEIEVSVLQDRGIIP